MEVSFFNTNKTRRRQSNDRQLPVQPMSDFASRDSSISHKDALSPEQSVTQPVDFTQLRHEAQARAEAAIDHIASLVEGDRVQTKLILESMVEYTQFVRTLERLRHLDACRSTPRTVAQQQRLIYLLQQQVLLLEKTVQQRCTNASAVKALLKKLEEATPERRRRTDAQHRAKILAQRRARIRSVYIWAINRMRRLENLTVSQRSLRQQLEQFSALEDFSHMPTTEDEQKRLEVVLEKLEPLSILLQPDIESLTDSPSLPPDTESEQESDELADLNTASPEDSFSSDSDDTEYGDEEDLVFSVSEPDQEIDESGEVSESESDEEFSVQTNVSAYTVQDIQQKVSETVQQQDDNQLVDELGGYELQRGDTLVDLLYGETAAGVLPCMYEIPQIYWSAITKHLRSYLDTYKTVRMYIGFSLEKQWAIIGDERQRISLDRLNDTIMYVAVQYRYVRLPKPGRRALEALFTPLEEKDAEAVEVNSYSKTKQVDQFAPKSVQHRKITTTPNLGIATIFKAKKQTPRKQLDHQSAKATDRPRTNALPKRTTAPPPKVSEEKLDVHEYVRDLERRAIRARYQHNAIAYQTDFKNWLQQVLLRGLQTAGTVGITERIFGVGEDDSQQVKDIAQVTVGEWRVLIESPMKRYEWLQAHGVRTSDWRPICVQVNRWLIKARSVGYMNDDMRLLTAAKLFYAHKVLTHHTSSQ